VTTLTRPILEPGRTCWVVSPVRSSGLLIDGRSYFRAFYEAAKAATRYLLIAGWQFDSDVSLLRGGDRTPESGPARFLEFLTSLCVARPDLRVVILCWDYSPAYMHDREWFQEFVFRRRSGGRVTFRFDDRHALGASHHQKFAVVDGALAFVGSMDFCHGRWDDRGHALVHPGRLEPSGEDTYGPYHEVQAYVTGPAVAELRELFEARWRLAGGEDLGLPEPAPDAPPVIRPSVRLGAPEVGLSRTVARTLIPEHPSVREIEALYQEAIASAESLVYIENQYFGSKAVFDALLRRIKERGRTLLQIVLVYPRDLLSLTESMSMGASQNGMFRALREHAARAGHAFGLYYSRSRGPGGAEKGRYIHSKVLLVDDRFLTVGSANTNNRSMGLDSELNVSWEASGEDRSIRRARISLLGEHAGLPPREALRSLAVIPGLVERLDRLADVPDGALRPRAVPPGPEEGKEWSALDPAGPILEDEVFEAVAPPRIALLRTGIRRLTRAFGGRLRLRRVLAVDPPGVLARSPSPFWMTVSRAFWRASLLSLLLAAALLVGWGVTALLRALLGQ
jgi:phospholipase D1/2